MWGQAEGRGYARVIHAEALVMALMAAFVTRMSGLREITQRMSARLGTNNFSSLSHALSRASTLSFARALVEHLGALHAPRLDELVALDSMPVTLAMTQRHPLGRSQPYTALFFSHNATASAVPEAARLRLRLEMENRPATGGTKWGAETASSASSLGTDPVAVTGVRVERLVRPQTIPTPQPTPAPTPLFHTTNRRRHDPLQ